MDITVTLSRQDTDRLFAIKEMQGKDGLSAAQFMEAMVERELHRLFPDPPQRGEDGALLNGYCYRGDR